MHVLILISIAKVPILEIAIETYLLLLVAGRRVFRPRAAGDALVSLSTISGVIETVVRFAFVRIAFVRFRFIALLCLAALRTGACSEMHCLHCLLLRFCGANLIYK